MKKLVKLIVLLFFASIVSNAQNAKEAIQNTKQIIEGKKMLDRDIKELETFNTKFKILKSAVNGDDQDEVDRLKEDLIKDMAREVEQSGVKAKMAHKEIAQSSAEIRSDRREIRRDKEDSKRGRYDRRDDEKDLARDRANKRDDQRDRRDDIRDFQQQIDRAKKQAELLKLLREQSFSLKYQTKEAFAERKKFVKTTFLSFRDTMKADIAATKRELAEDNRERREDRRERVDDRNERDENDLKKKRKRW
ncbi:hypothetical protein [Hyunsoonleella aestuarii]|uniref:Uncharacterized protein n=1 Tax=Hyunsoonleella aestuarii TaxID=912802 RepID=A0ABP8E7V8_9FLAO|nr:hypothetical protein [Hyunsoonleella aestuarii]